jgi:hypothetical protein
VYDLVHGLVEGLVGQSDVQKNCLAGGCLVAKDSAAWGLVQHSGAEKLEPDNHWWDPLDTGSCSMLIQLL